MFNSPLQYMKRKYLQVITELEFNCKGALQWVHLY